MSENLFEDLKNLLNDANLSTYEINAFIALLKSSRLKSATAKELSIKSDVPKGRIYETLEDLNAKGLVEIIESRPKRFKAIPFNKALENLISYQKNETRRKINYLYDKAKILESELYQKDIVIKKEPTKLFLSTVFGSKSIVSLYVKFINEAKEEILFNKFISKNTIKILPYGKMMYEPIKNAIDRGVIVKTLWCFQYDDLLNHKEVGAYKLKIFKQILQILEKNYDLSTNLPNYEIKYIPNRIPTLFDIIDKKRVLLKLQNPVKHSQIFTCVNMIDPKLAYEFRKKFLRIWLLDALDDKHNA
ncbi:MAG: TrmB family transcriptional regulator [Promethearchaeota archaeon]